MSSTRVTIPPYHAEEATGRALTVQTSGWYLLVRTYLCRRPPNDLESTGRPRGRARARRRRRRAGHGAGTDSHRCLALADRHLREAGQESARGLPALREGAQREGRAAGPQGAGRRLRRRLGTGNALTFLT